MSPPSPTIEREMEPVEPGREPAQEVAPRRPGRTGFVLALVVLVCSLLLVVLSWRAARERELAASQAEFEAATRETVDLLQQRLVNYELTVRGGVALFATVARPSPLQWRAFVDGLELPQRFPALTGLGFAAYVTPHGLERLQLESRAAGYGLFNVWPRGIRAQYGPILYLEPRTAENISALGFDMYSEPVRRAAMDAARDTGTLRMSGRVRLLQDADRDVAGLLIYAPVYRAGDAPSSIRARRMSMQGWVYVPFRVNRYVEVALRPMRRELHFRLYDITEAKPELLYADPGFEQNGHHAFAHSLTTEHYGRRWRFDFVSGPEPVAAPAIAALRNTLVVGLFASLLLFGIAWSMALTEARAQRIAARMTAAHRRSEAHVLALNRSLEARVAVRTRELSEANRELESFAYSVSHDLRAPLRAIEGFSGVLGERYAAILDETGRDYLGRVRNAASRMGELIDALLKLSRLGRSELKLEPLDLSRIATEIVEELHAGEPGREVAVDIGSGLRATGDPVLVRSLLQNLIGNAWKFTRSRDDAQIEFAANLAGEFFVRDNGAGFNEAYADKLFRPFQRLHDDTGFVGDGIGLASVKRIVERHGGTIRAEGQEGEGAAFYFSLPAESGE
ncbi:CHASE domain-containing protein [Lysobacter sp. CFH 32150]|uniref:sensor histidine kinase n=1 Tax=Lysobacter sp. CFH 32150 TaxID=2927128 RepID=UPI001FA7033D|nr:CHASE domain-containing protein [Lysobacter sp. CFH 32150]MCI4567063.1 CHASE domain-containing protein [Lysobacter sp. CFH 32150]